MSALLIMIMIAITALPVAAIGGLGRRSTFAGASLASLPLTSLLATV